MITLTPSAPNQGVLAGGNRISVIGGVIKVASGDDDRRAQAASFEVLPQITAGIDTRAGSLVVTVTFTAPVNRDADGEARFATSALNPAHYQINDAALPRRTPRSSHRVLAS